VDQMRFSKTDYIKLIYNIRNILNVIPQISNEVMWLEIKIKVGIILLNIIYRSPTEAGSLFWNSYRKMISDALDCSSKIRPNAFQ
jgi:hypothetical protein